MSVDVPEKCVDFCKEMAELAVKYEVSSFTMDIRDFNNTMPDTNTRLIWDSGRHNADSAKIQIRIEKTEWHKIKLPWDKEETNE